MFTRDEAAGCPCRLREVEEDVFRRWSRRPVGGAGRGRHEWSFGWWEFRRELRGEVTREEAAGGPGRLQEVEEAGCRRWRRRAAGGAGDRLQEQAA